MKAAHDVCVCVCSWKWVNRINRGEGRNYSPAVLFYCFLLEYLKKKKNKALPQYKLSSSPFDKEIIS